MHDVDVGGWVPSASATARVGIFHVPYTHRARAVGAAALASRMYRRARI